MDISYVGEPEDDDYIWYPKQIGKKVLELAPVEGDWQEQNGNL